MNLSDLANELESRGLTLLVHGETGWVVWVYAADDPALGVWVGEDVDLGEAIAKAILKWDGGKPS